MDETEMSKKILGSKTDSVPEEKKNGKLAGGQCDLVCFQKRVRNVRFPWSDGGSTDERRGQKKGQKRC